MWFGCRTRGEGDWEESVTRGQVAEATRQRALVLSRADQGPKGPGSVDAAIMELVGVSVSGRARADTLFLASDWPCRLQLLVLRESGNHNL